MRLLRDLAFARKLPGAALRDILRPCHDALAKFVRWATEDPACHWANETDQGDL